MDCCEINEKELNEIRDSMIQEDDSQSLALLFKMYADPTRLKILSTLFQKELCVCDIAYLLNMTHSAVSHQLAILRNNRIVRTKREGKKIYYSLADDHIELIYNNGLDHIKED